MSRSSLPIPEGYGVVELPSGRFYPIWTDGIERYPSFTALLWQYQEIPFATGVRRPEGPVSFPSRREAIAYCHFHHEAWKLLFQWQQQARADEMHPERNSWYREAILALGKAHTSLWLTNEPISVRPYLDEVSARFSWWMEGRYQTIECKAAESDNAYELLYRRVCEELGAQLPYEECFPERNAVYKEEIESLTGSGPTTYCWHGRAVAYVEVAPETLIVREATVDEALERLCEQVYHHLGLDLWQNEHNAVEIGGTNGLV